MIKLYEEIINVYGPPGSGKTSYKNVLMQILGCDMYLDEPIAFRPHTQLPIGGKLLLLSQKPITSFAGQEVRSYNIDEVLPIRTGKSQ